MRCGVWRSSGVAESPIRFLSVQNVCALHGVTLRRDGGLAGIKNPGLLEAAVAIPRQQFGGAYPQESVPAMAAAYLFHLCMNQAFNDGNKRMALLAAYVFAAENGFAFKLNQGEVEWLVLDVAAGKTNKAALAVVSNQVLVVMDQSKQ